MAIKRIIGSNSALNHSIRNAVNSLFSLSMGFLAIASNLLTECLAQSPPPPNIVIILVDDLGYGDVNFELEGIREFNNPHVHTPQLAQLAKESLVFRHHYAAAPVCSPSRAGLLTGRTPTRCNIDLYISDLRDNNKRFLAGPEITLAEVARSAGYDTALFGKWHLNGADWEAPESWTGWTGSFPKQQGFEYGFVTKENPHVTRSLQVNTQRHPGDYYSVSGKALGTLKGYSSDLISAAALDWLSHRKNQETPFLLYLPYDAVHIRISSPDRFEKRYDTGNPNRDCYYANISHLDDAIGTFLKGLQDRGLEENTIVFFSSDNGPDVLNKWHGTGKCYGTSYPLHGHKYMLQEGGIRVPGMVRWPGKIQPGISDEPNSTVDLFPTVCALTRQPLPPDHDIDGTNLLPLWLQGKKLKRDRPLYWQFEHPKDYHEEGLDFLRLMNGRREKKQHHPNVSIRRGDFVLRGIGSTAYQAPTAFELFDVVNDPEEQTELSTRQPSQFNSLRAELLEMHHRVEVDRQATLRFIQTQGQTLTPTPATKP